MTQAPIGSGYDEHTTADEVLAGIDLSGKLALVTGGYSGIGIETTRALASAGAQVVVPARRRETAEAAVAGIDGVEVDELDLADQDSVRAFAERFLETGRHLDVVIDSAGIMAIPETRTPAGWELQLATNHLGHFALVNRLWPALTGGARVVSVSSRGHHYSGMRWDDPWFDAGDYEKYVAYGQSKTANVLFAVHLDRLGRQHGVRAFALHPGRIITPLMRYQDQQEFVDAGIIDADGNPIDPTLKSPEQGAATQVWAATSPQLDGLGGLYLEDCEVAIPAPDGERVGVKDWAIDPEQAARLWAWSAELTGVDAFGS
ncbi:SDR family NAD(P)-dependent oxidoreductase [Nocardioides sp. CN2-186]|uniref:SDR family NAD(P)-dependent oxidoreductase n=1 Tax=Nocardioides tweenelious TaxID=3156607 RepID=UPI0032B36480